MPLPAEHLCCLFCQKPIISQQAVQKVIDCGQRLHCLGKTRMDGVARLLRTIPQLPDAKIPQIFPENTNEEPLPVPGWLCMGGKRQRFIFRADSKISFQFLRGIIGRKPKEPCGEVNHITAGSAAEAVETIIHFHAGMVILVEGTFHHAASVDRQPIPFGCLSGGYGLLDSRVG